MASNREMNALGRDPARVRSLTLGLLKLAETAENIFTEWELTFLRSLVGQTETTVGLAKKQQKQKDAGRLTARQAEKLLDIRDATVLHRDIGGVSIRSLINPCYEGRCDLAEDDARRADLSVGRRRVARPRPGKAQTLQRAARRARGLLGDPRT
jgi:hypothetical protein